MSTLRVNILGDLGGLDRLDLVHFWWLVGRHEPHCTLMGWERERHFPHASSLARILPFFLLYHFRYRSLLLELSDTIVNAPET